MVSVTDIRSGIRVDTKIALAFLKRYPTPADARGLVNAAFLARHVYTGRKPARKLLGRCAQAPTAAPGSSRPSLIGL